MVDAIAPSRPPHVLYVPPRRASIISVRPDLLVRTAAANAVAAAAPKPISPLVHADGHRSAFTAVCPRLYHQNRTAGWGIEPSRHLPKLASIQQSYSKLFARNELLKLLVTKQLRSLYAQNAAQDQHNPTATPPTNRNITDVATTSPLVVGDSKQPAHRLLELSSVIKTINASKQMPAMRTEEGNACGGAKVVPRSHLHVLADLMPWPGNVSSEQLVFRCDWSGCNRSFDTAEQWTIHVTHTHVIADPDDGLYYCQWKDCPRAPNGFNARYKMLIHVRSHTNDKPYRCPHCAKSFLRSETLRIHKRIHSSEKLFACKYLGCTKRYTDPSSLRKHVKTKNHIVIEV